jgi:pilus assembly protein Flp/PilA
MGIANTLAMIRVPKSFLADESAVTAIEYAMIAGIIAIVIVTAVGSMGSTLSGFFVTLSAAL